jgi:hypothetical protein
MSTHTLSTEGNDPIPNAKFNIDTTQFEGVPGILSEDGKIYTALGSDWNVDPPVERQPALEPPTGGRKRRSSKKYKKGGNKQTMSMGGRKSKKCKKGGKRPKKTRRH